MRGIVLAGGTGSRLGAVTKAVNKHCLLVHDRPMIMWPLKVFKDWGISDITIVSSTQGLNQLHILLGSTYSYREQKNPGGIVDALLCAESTGDDQVAVILGDNIFYPTPMRFTDCYLYPMLKSELSAFGVPKIVDGKIEYIVEKPIDPPSYYALTGLYIFRPDVFEKAKKIVPSPRGETEITDLLNCYSLTHTIIEGFWGDAGTIDGIYNCTKFLRRTKCEY